MGERTSLFDQMVNIDWQKLWKEIPAQGKYYSVECDDAEGCLHVGPSCDGDFHLSLWQGRNQHGLLPTFRARTLLGGGRNEHVRKALALLALAIKEDTERRGDE